MLPLPRARPFSIASSTSAFPGARVSRFGPTFALAFAAFSVWHIRQCSPNSSRPRSCSGVSSLTPARGIELRSLSAAITASGTAKPSTTSAIRKSTIPLRRPSRVVAFSRLLLGPPLNARNTAPSARSTKRSTKARVAIGAGPYPFARRGGEAARRAAAGRPRGQRRRPAAKLWTAGATPRKSASAPSAGTSSGGRARARSLSATTSATAALGADSGSIARA